MRFSRALVFACVVASTLRASPHAQSRGNASQPPGGIPPVVDIVEVVGCLESAPNDAWVLTRATTPELERRPTSSPESLKAAALKPLGTQRYRLFNIAVFNPAPHQGQKMAVRGILIKDPKEPRINTMSFQMLDAACAK